MTGKAVLLFLYTESESRQFGTAALLAFGDDEMMPRTIEATPRCGFEALDGCCDCRIDDTRPARDCGEIGLTRGGRFQSAAAFIGFVVQHNVQNVAQILVRQVSQARQI